MQSQLSMDRETRPPIDVTLQSSSESSPKHELDLSAKIEYMEIDEDTKHDMSTKLEVGDKVQVKSIKNDSHKGGKVSLYLNVGCIPSLKIWARINIFLRL